jgi:hypothetical protein
MKRWLSFICHIVLFGALTSFVAFSSSYERYQVPDALRVYEQKPVLFPQPFLATNNQADKLVFLGNTYVGFRESVGFKESQGDYNAVNTLGYLGKYQFGKNTLKLMGVNDTEHFMATPKLQEKVFELNVARNKWILRRDIKRFVGKKINGTVITESGIVAAAHLAGAGNVKKYLRSYGSKDFSDAYGSNVKYYMKRFAGYDISIIEAKQKPKV